MKDYMMCDCMKDSYMDCMCNDDKMMERPLCDMCGLTPLCPTNYNKPKQKDKKKDKCYDDIVDNDPIYMGKDNCGCHMHDKDHCKHHGDYMDDCMCDGMHHGMHHGMHCPMMHPMMMPYPMMCGCYGMNPMMMGGYGYGGMNPMMMGGYEGMNPMMDGCGYGGMNPMMYARDLDFEEFDIDDD